MRQTPAERESGAVAVVVALLAVVLFGLGALVVDLGEARTVRAQARNAADSAALSAVQALSEGKTPAEAVQVAKDIAASDADVKPEDWIGCSDSDALPLTPDGGNSCISIDAALETVEVRIPDRSVTASFGGLLGVTRVAVTGVARATVAVPSRCLVCVLGDYNGEHGQIQVTGGGIAIDGDAFQTNRGRLEATPPGSVQIVGSFPSRGAVSPAPVRIPRFADPLALMPLPPAGAAPLGSPAVVGTGACDAGQTYQTINGCTSFTPGVYVVTRPSTLSSPATGVLLYLACETPLHVSRACDPGEHGASLTTVGSAQLLTGLDVPGYGLFGVVFDRNNTQPYEQAGNGVGVVAGGIYGASATIDNDGEGTFAFNGLLVAQVVSFDGQHPVLEDSVAGTAFEPRTTPYLIR